MPAGEAQVEEMPPPASNTSVEQFPKHEEFSYAIWEIEAEEGLD